jgi:3,4-dihydroxy 2-butanone 4-phosphate synthase/GTP cyclohydrolase II
MIYTNLTDFYTSFSRGEICIVFDEKREKEADFFVLGEFITPEKINFFLENGKGMITVPCTYEILERLKIPKMIDINECPFSTTYSIPVDAKNNVTTGVSAFDRSEVIKLLASKKSNQFDFVRPGHTTPLIAQNPKKRFGHTECAVELAKKLNKTPVVAICEILNKEGYSANKKEIFDLSSKYNIPITSLEILKKEILN